MATDWQKRIRGFSMRLSVTYREGRTWVIA